MVLAVKKEGARPGDREGQRGQAAIRTQAAGKRRGPNYPREGR